MDIHYNAFISYRHHPDDIKVAMQLHRKLEHFHIPGAIRKRSGIKSLHLFRDKEELPTTGSLSDDITQALEHSDYLIVICSPHTKESVWVQREIEIFLQTHTREQVLTVLADGEPADVLPEILLYEDIVDPETGECKRMPVEPLSCDWRIKKRKAIREELPRLTSALLGCGYDELRQRQRQYRMRRTTSLVLASLVVLLGLGAFLFHMDARLKETESKALESENKAIESENKALESQNLAQESQIEALQRQSEYLAATAAKKLDDDDIQMAIALALEALPTEGSERPYVAQAEQVLSKALNSYETDEIVQVAAFTVDNTAEMFEVSDEGKLAIVDAADILTVWDTQTGEKCGLVDDLSGITEIAFIAEENILVNADGWLSCYSSKGEFLWKQENSWGAAFLDERTKVLVLDYDYEYWKLLTLNAKNGKTVDEISLVSSEGEFGYLGFAQLDQGSDSPVVLNDWYTGKNYLMNLQTGELGSLSGPGTEGQVLLATNADTSGNLFFMYGEMGDHDLFGEYNVQVSKPRQISLFCCDAETMETVWQSEFVTYASSEIHTIEFMSEGMIVFQTGDVIQVHDCLTGQRYGRCQVPEDLLEITIVGDTIFGLTKEGSLLVCEYSDGICVSVPVSAGSLTDGDCASMLALGQNKNYVASYASRKNPDAEPHTGDEKPVGNEEEISKEDIKIDLTNKQALSAIAYQDQTLVLCANGILYRYDREGQLLSETELTLKRTAANGEDEIFWWLTDDGDLILRVFSTGYIIDCETWQIRASVPGLCTYIADSDKLVCTATNFFSVGESDYYTYPRYTTEQQIERAREALGDFSLTEEQRRQYGLE